ncbi:endoplasmic reticulum mannosyl-oligosaccharide 1,2-alpha-mannosidase [Rhypophila decipiens]
MANFAAIGSVLVELFTVVVGEGLGTRRDAMVRFAYRQGPSSFNWTSFPPFQAMPIIHHLPKSTSSSKLLPVQHTSFESYVHSQETISRQKAVKDAFLRSWDAYKSHAWLADELSPVSGRPKKTFAGLSATLIDPLNTLYITDLADEFQLAAAVAVETDGADTSGDTSCNLFETTIRYLGGLLSAYDLSGEVALLQKAKELGDMLLMAFDTPNRLPPTGKQVAGFNDPSASPGSLSLEFTRLAQLTGQDEYFDAISRVTDFLDKTQNETRIPGIWARLINFRGEKVTDSGFSLGAPADCLYLVKMVLLLGDGTGIDESPGEDEAIKVVEEHLVFRPMLPPREEGQTKSDTIPDILFMDEAVAYPDRITALAESQHLSYFTGGMFGLGRNVFGLDDQFEIGEKLARGCAWAYGAFPTGVMPEIFGMVACPQGRKAGPWEWDEELWEAKTKKPGDGNENMDIAAVAAAVRLKKIGFRETRDSRYILCPEAIESSFLLYRMTGMVDLRDTAWRMFESVMKATKSPLANSAIKDVTVEGETDKLDSMEMTTKMQSFWLAETLKYFYLIFSPPDLINLDEFVFNTEAHPFRRPGVER